MTLWWEYVTFLKNLFSTIRWGIFYFFLNIFHYNEFKLANRKIWKIQTNITCHSRNIYSLQCKLCMCKTYTSAYTINDHIHVFKTKMSNSITKSGSGVSKCKLHIHAFNSIKRNNRQLEEPFLYIYVLLSLKSISRLELLGTLFHKRGNDTLNNSSRIWYIKQSK